MVAAAHSWNLPASTMVARSRHLILMTSMAATTAGIPVQRGGPLDTWRIADAITTFQWTGIA
jgi:hypothetical protein